MPKDVILFELAIDLTSPLDLALAISPTLQLAIERLRPLELEINPTMEFTMVEF